ncbi:NAD(P)-binding oxidoreductase [Ureibacillus sp. FSL K6-8385]|uniref:SDR family oxidoreductase n=1 Tax=Ureibacillus terrenus TaxID=118246 RepID=A0A540V2U3_9BACL|nr:NAD(P)-binding oxidoreductase [Ureibacillus terrenus]MED3662093.1 SDR family oxidoreductase [Ureibacillus terrenus]MED3763589.1 SDR family oxidoreductase [Ureibacillus terrenus]TQE91075.1 SDR family oxidoreductase [Ureibacillus terrenus]
MKVIVFGSTGGVGRQVVKQALEKGFEVTAFVRTPSKMELKHEKLHVIQGDAFNKKEVSAAIAGHDVVVSCLGSSKGMKKSTELEEMTKNIVDGMKKHHVKRIIYTASAGIDGEIPGISGKMVMQMLKHALADHRNAVNYIKSNELSYTIVRPMGLTNDPFTGKYREAKEGVPKNSRTIPRADVAHFIVKALTDEQYENASIAIAT